MFDVVNSKNGTAYNPEIERFNICGKTGTAQNPHGDDHSIYIAFAPKIILKLLFLFLLKMLAGDLNGLHQLEII